MSTLPLCLARCRRHPLTFAQPAISFRAFFVVTPTLAAPRLRIWHRHRHSARFPRHGVVRSHRDVRQCGGDHRVHLPRHHLAEGREGGQYDSSSHACQAARRDACVALRCGAVCCSMLLVDAYHLRCASMCVSVLYASSACTAPSRWTSSGWRSGSASGLRWAWSMAALCRPLGQMARATTRRSGEACAALQISIRCACRIGHAHAPTVPSALFASTSHCSHAAHCSILVIRLTSTRSASAFRIQTPQLRI